MANPISLPWQTDALKHPVFKPFNDVLAFNHHPQFPSIDQLNDRLNHCKQALEISHLKQNHAWTDQEQSIYQALKLVDQQKLDHDLYYEVALNLKSKLDTSKSKVSPLFIWFFKNDFIDAVKKIVEEKKDAALLKKS